MTKLVVLCVCIGDLNYEKEASRAIFQEKRFLCKWGVCMCELSFPI